MESILFLPGIPIRAIVTIAVLPFTYYQAPQLPIKITGRLIRIAYRKRDIYITTNVYTPCLSIYYFNLYTLASYGFNMILSMDSLPSTV